LIAGESLPRSSVRASAAASSSAGQTLISGNRPRPTRYPAPIEQPNKKEPASEGKGTAQLKRLELRSVVKEHQRQGHLDDVVLSTSPLISVRPSTAPPTMKTIGPVDPAETHRLAHEQDDQESEDSDTDDKCQSLGQPGKRTGSLAVAVG
jgi:hypothetical protein